MTRIPRPPQSNRNGLIQFFIKFHQNAVTHAHYFLFYDFQQLCGKLLFAMAEQFDALRFAMAAFSALIYSVKIDIAERERALLYYSIALYELRLRLQTSPNNIAEYLGTVATVLLLSTFDVSSLEIVSLISAFSERVY